MRYFIQHGLPSDQRSQAAALYWEAFHNKLHPLMQPEAKARLFLEAALQPDHAICAIGPKGDLLGLAGVKTENGAMVGGGLPDLARVYGWPGAVWRGALLTFLERQIRPGVLLMDGICVASTMRGQGIGKALLDAVKSLAAERGDHAVRLDVITTNNRAEALYRREGFAPVKRQGTGPLCWLAGFGSALQMEYAVAQKNA
ncbi:MAG: GNAT family N-acetyltransferase [Pseudorhodobacter sp.]